MFHHLQNTWSEIRHVLSKSFLGVIGWYFSPKDISYDMSDSEATLEMRCSYPSPPVVPVSAWMFLSCFSNISQIEMPKHLWRCIGEILDMRTRKIIVSGHIYSNELFSILAKNDSMKFPHRSCKFLRVVHDTTEIKEMPSCWAMETTSVVPTHLHHKSCFQVEQICFFDLSPCKWNDQTSHWVGWIWIVGWSISLQSANRI